VGVVVVIVAIRRRGRRRRITKEKTGVTDRARTGDIQNHNLGLYQLSYGHRWEKAI
tara:strand:+ start:900 stop:1067 length:168 start_codon:yes stop_codon:yes gene_type:complete